MQRSLLSMSKLVKKNEAEIQEAYKGLKLSDREEYDQISSGVVPAKAEVKPEKVVEKEQPASAWD